MQLVSKKKQQLKKKRQYDVLSNEVNARHLVNTCGSFILSPCWSSKMMVRSPTFVYLFMQWATSWTSWISTAEDGIIRAATIKANGMTNQEHFRVDQRMVWYCMVSWKVCQGKRRRSRLSAYQIEWQCGIIEFGPLIATLTFNQSVIIGSLIN